MYIYKADINDVETLVRLRVDFIMDDGVPPKTDDVEGLRRALKAYFDRAIPAGQLVAFLAEDEGEVRSTAFLTIVERPPRSADCPFITGTVYNVYTYPSHRRKGYAYAIMRELIKEARGMGMASVDLLATEAGRALYETLGFEKGRHTFMRKKLV